MYKFDSQAVNKIVIVSGIDRSDHNPNDYTLYYTTDANPTIGGNWTPLAGVHFLNSVAGGSISGNHVTCNGQDEVQLGFNPVTATGIKIVIYGSNAGNENSVLTEFKIYASESVTKYYYAGSQRVAMRQDGVVTYLHGDHLGSTSLTTCGTDGACGALGEKVARVLYYPYGEEWYVEGTLTTDYGFTGQRKDTYLDTYSMGAREYDPSLGRWLSADTIVPDPANPQSFNRYSYVYNNPLKYVDPSGHIAENEAEGANNILEELQRDYDVHIEKDWRYIEFEGKLVWTGGVWSLEELEKVLLGVKDLAQKMSDAHGGTMDAATSFRQTIGAVTIRKGLIDDPDYLITYLVYGLYPAGLTNPVNNVVSLYRGFSERSVVHELGHVWDNKHLGMLSGILARYTTGEVRPTDYADSTFREQWAETVECWVYGIPARDQQVFGKPATLGNLHKGYVTAAARDAPIGIGVHTRIDTGALTIDIRVSITP